MYLGAAGMSCSVGLGAAAACAALRAGVAKFDELPYFEQDGEPVIGAAVPVFSPDLKRADRLLALLSLALEDLLRSPPEEPLARVPILVGLAEPGRPGGGADLAASIIPRLEARLGVSFHPGLSRAIAKGHTAGFEALRAARELLRGSAVRCCLVCGVDSYINAPALLWLQESGRLKTDDNSDGVIPGEAGGAIFLQRDPTAPGRNAVEVSGLGFATERATILSEEPLLGLGMAEAARQALAEARIQMHEIGFRLADVTGESYGFKEQALMLSRVLRVRREEFPIWHCADSIGDTGAASGICQLITASHAFRVGYAPGDRAMCSTGSVLGDRAVALLQSRGT